MFGSQTLGAMVGTKGLFLAKFNAAGKWIWVKAPASGNYNAEPPSIFYDSNNKLAISGSYTGTAVFGSSMNQPTGPASLQKSFITSLDTAGVLNWTNVVNGTSSNQNSGLTGDATGHYYISGSYFYNQGIVKNTDFRRYSFRSNLDQVINDKLSFFRAIVFISPRFNRGLFYSYIFIFLDEAMLQ